MSRARIYLVIAAILVSSAHIAAAQKVKVFIPTSDAIDIARVVAKNLGYSLKDPHRYFFDELRTKDGASLYPGYVTIEFVWEGSDVTAVSISEKTLQVIDMMACLVYDYPELRADRDDFIRETGNKPMTLDELRAVSDCGSRLEVRTAPTHK